MTCPRFNACNAPLCPENPPDPHMAWFPGEAICPREGMPEWVKRQRHINRATGGDFNKGFFTLSMISHPCIIRKGMTGLDPDKGETSDAAVREWIKRHPVLSEKSRQNRSTRARQAVSTGQLRGRGRRVVKLPQVAS
jgi:hypothetical protein